MLLTLLINGFRVPMFINMLITRLGIISPTLNGIKSLKLLHEVMLLPYVSQIGLGNVGGVMSKAFILSPLKIFIIETG